MRHPETPHLLHAIQTLDSVAKMLEERGIHGVPPQQYREWPIGVNADSLLRTVATRGLYRLDLLLGSWFECGNRWIPKCERKIQYVILLQVSGRPKGLLWYHTVGVKLVQEYPPESQMITNVYKRMHVVDQRALDTELTKLHEELTEEADGFPDFKRIADFFASLPEDDNS